MTYRAGFRAEPGVNCRVVFPVPEGAVQGPLMGGLRVSDGGTAFLDTSPEGVGLALEGRGSLEVSYEATVGEGVGEGGIPEVSLSRGVADGGVELRTVKVNKGGSPLVPLTFEFAAKRECGGGCGGTRSWRFDSSVGLSLQEVSMTYFEEKQK